MNRRVVVTGLGCVSPVGNDVQSTWEALREGRSGTEKISRFDASEYRCQVAAELKGFDASVVLDKTEMRKMDLFIHYALVAAQEAINDGNLLLEGELAERTGVSLGIGIGGLGSIEKNHEILLERGPRKVTPFLIPMIIPNMAAGQVSMRFNCRNYSACTTSACASSNHSIGDGFRILQRGDADVMVTGGTEAPITPLGISGFAAMKALSTRNDDPQHASRPYDVSRDGFVMGEGAGILILEEYQHARKRGAKIYCELIGYGSSSDAHHITAPSTEGPARSMKSAMKDAQVNVEEIDYINAHGTSTPLGDLNELNALKMVLGDYAKNINISSTKSMVGHLLGASGAIEAVATIQCMKAGVVHPTINIDELDPACDLDVTPNEAKERDIKVAMSNSFGFGGTNATLLFRAI